MLYADARWCGPRVLYFFSCYLRGQSQPLDDVVKACESDGDGRTSLSDLVRAAKRLGLNPLAVECAPEDLAQSGGPAVICVQLGAPSRTGALGAASQPLVHFVGVLRPEGSEPLWVIDPSRRTAAFPVDNDLLLSGFTGQAIFLDGAAPERLLLARRLRLGALLAAALATMLAVAKPVGRRIKARRFWAGKEGGRTC